MAFYIYEQPAFAMEHFHPAFISRPRHWNLLENLFNQEQMFCESTQHCSKTKSVQNSEEKSSCSLVQGGKMGELVEKTNEENKIVEPVIETTSKQFMSCVSCQEDMEKVEIKIQLHGHKFKAENLDIQVINSNVLVVKAEDEEEKFERKFKLPFNALVDKIESKFDIKEENTQTLAIHVPKEIKRIQVPISMEE